MELNDLETKMAVLIESIASLSRITANHDTLLTKLVEDHELRIRKIENAAVPGIEGRIRDIESWRWWTVGLAVGLSMIITVMSVKAGF